MEVRNMARKPSTTVLEPDTQVALENTENTTQNGDAVTATIETDTQQEEAATPEEQAAADALAAVEKNDKPEIPEADFSAFDAAVEAILAPHRHAEANGESTSGVPDEDLIPELVT